MEYNSSEGWKRTHDVIVGGWQQLCDVLTSSRDMWAKCAQQRGVDNERLRAEITELRAQLRELKAKVHEYES